nr:uncharacterized protein LOC109151056 isoform X4 [Ipomoea trifida]
MAEKGIEAAEERVKRRLSNQFSLCQSYFRASCSLGNQSITSSGLCEQTRNCDQLEANTTSSGRIGSVVGGHYFSGFGSDIVHYFPEAMIHRKSNIGPSTSHTSCEARIKQLEEQNRVMQQQQQQQRDMQQHYPLHLR